MKKLCTNSGILITVLVTLLLATTTTKSQQTNNQLCDKIVFDLPSIKCGEYKWNDQIILNWLKNNCIDKCDDQNSSGYNFVGKIIETDKNNSLKVVVTTNKDYAQPIWFNPVDGTFKGTLYFDKIIHEKTTIKLMLRDSTRTVIDTFIITIAN